jgi:hypothetical protein
MPIERHSGRPRSRTWIGKLGAFVDSVGATRLAGEFDADLRQIYGWARGDYRPPLQKAIAEIARLAGTNLSLEDIYESDVLRIRVRMRSSSFPAL